MSNNHKSLICSSMTSQKLLLIRRISRSSFSDEMLNRVIERTRGSVLKGVVILYIRCVVYCYTLKILNECMGINRFLNERDWITIFRPKFIISLFELTKFLLKC